MEQAEALAAYQDYIKKNPQHKEFARQDFRKTFGIDPEAKQPLFGLAKKAAARKLGIEVEQTKAGYEQDVRNAWAKFAGDVSKTLPVAATLATGGLGAIPAAGVLGLAGAASGSYEEAARLALGATDTAGYEGVFGTGAKKAPTPSEQPAQSPAQLAKRIGIDALLSTTTEVGGRLTGKLLAAAGRKVWEPMIARAAAKSDAGERVLAGYGGKLLNKLRAADAATGNAPVSIQKELDDLEAAIALRKTGPSDTFKGFWGRSRTSPPALSPGSPGSGMAEKIAEWQAKGATASGLAEIKGSLSQAAFKRAGFNHEEEEALKVFAEKIDEKLHREFGRIGGTKAQEIYKGYKETIAQTRRFSGALTFGEQAIQRFSYRTAYGYALGGGALGAAEGGRRGGIEGAAKGAVVGAAAGAGFKTLEQRAAPALLAHMLADKEAGPLTRHAMNLIEKGDIKQAWSVFNRALAQVGVREALGPIMKEMAEQNAPKEVPNAAPQR